MSEDKDKQDIRLLQKRIKVLYILIGIVFIWLGYACWCDLKFGTDGSAGLFMTAMGVMVTALVGWQIYNAIEIRNSISQHEEVIKKYETRINQLERDIKRKSIENRYYSKYISLLIKTRDEQKWGDNALFYMDTCEAMKCLLLSGFKDVEPNDSDKALFDLLVALDGCLNELKQKEDSVKIKIFNNYSSLVDDLYTSIIAIISKHPDVDNNYFKLINNLHSKRKRMLDDFGSISQEEIEEMLNTKMGCSSKTDNNGK